MSEKKQSNPKDALGISKVPLSTVSMPVLAELGVAMLEGAMKYGRHNYRVVGVRASVYYDAVVARHMASWWEGEDIDPDSGLSHITKAITSLVVLRDSMIQGNWVDDRPPRSPPGWLAELNEKVKALIAKYPDAKEPFTEIGKATPANDDRQTGVLPTPGDSKGPSSTETVVDRPLCEKCNGRLSFKKSQRLGVCAVCREKAGETVNYVSESSE